MLFFQASVIFLGDVLSADRISANPEKVEKVRDWQLTKNSKELHSFLSLAFYYHQFNPNFAHIAKCLHQLIGPTIVKKTKEKKVRKKVTSLEEKKSDLTQPTFFWTSEHQKASNTLKVALATAPVLRYPNFNREFILETDALRGLGAVLCQVDETDKVHVIAYTSQTLTPSEKSMHSYSSAKL